MWKRILGLLTDAATYGASSVIGQLIGFVLLPLYTRNLTPDDYGVIAMLAVVTTLFPAIANLGIQSAIYCNFNRTKDEERRRDVLSTGLLAVAISALTFLGVSLLLATPIAELAIGDASRSN